MDMVGMVQPAGRSASVGHHLKNPLGPIIIYLCDPVIPPVSGPSAPVDREVGREIAGGLLTPVLLSPPAVLVNQLGNLALPDSRLAKEEDRLVGLSIETRYLLK